MMSEVLPEETREHLAELDEFREHMEELKESAEENFKEYDSKAPEFFMGCLWGKISLLMYLLEKYPR